MIPDYEPHNNCNRDIFLSTIKHIFKNPSLNLFSISLSAEAGVIDPASDLGPGSAGNFTAVILGGAYGPCCFLRRADEADVRSVQ
jgi:hypothetical protein